MTAHLVIVTGTATEIGKTHVAEALLLAWQRQAPRVTGLKPAESGVSEGQESDATRLQRASSFHVKHFGHSYPEPLSPHLAARRAGAAFLADPVLLHLSAIRRTVDGIVLELPGGLFTPLHEALLNVDFALRCEPDAVLLVAPDRLGVLHDVLSTETAAWARGLPLAAVVLVAPERPDPSTGTNAPELARLLPLRQGRRPLVAPPLPRATPADLSAHPSVRGLLPSP